SPLPSAGSPTVSSARFGHAAHGACRHDRPTVTGWRDSTSRPYHGATSGAGQHAKRDAVHGGVKVAASVRVPSVTKSRSVQSSYAMPVTGPSGTPAQPTVPSTVMRQTTWHGSAAGATNTTVAGAPPPNTLADQNTSWCVSLTAS